jgi:exopolyphosphatase/pppGpp-phosphohydrolase
VAVGGTATNLVRFAPDGAAVDRVLIADVFDALAARPASDLAAEKLISLRRARQMAAGAAMLDAILARYDLPSFEISDASLREGALHASAAENVDGGSWLEHLPALLR